MGRGGPGELDATEHMKGIHVPRTPMLFTEAEQISLISNIRIIIELDWNYHEQECFKSYKNLFYA